ncbi:DUF1963 domain-containing protein [Blastococcus montanus]|uniref:DUF1963 domain-containing protein n=1 Tax=Blastococcus montanus TaxID=3144973 RepID=UPI00320B77B3
MESEPDVAELLERVVAGYEQLARWEVEIPGVGQRQWNRYLARLSALKDRLMASPAGFAALQEVARSHPDESVRTRARDAVAPAPPSGVEDARDWLRHPRQALGRLDHMVEPCLYYAPLPAEHSADYVEALPELVVGRGSWVRGHPVDVGSWPLREDGIPLDFVGHFDLWMLSTVADRAPLPETNGALEVFHDLESYGIDGGARDRGCWQVRFVPPVTRYLTEPEDLTVQPARWLHEWGGFSLPSPSDLPDLSSEEFDRLEQATADVLDEALSTAGDRRRRPVGELRFVPQLLGRPQQGWGHIVSEALEPFLPCGPDDGWVLLLDIPAVGPLDGWFGGDGHLEVWMRRSDLVRGDYEQAWVTIRLN